MEDAIKNFAKQFSFEPIVKNNSKLKQFDSFVVCGMGGSHLSAGLLKISNPGLDIYIHRDYDLPKLSEKRFKNSLFIASSYSGNTEEVLDFAKKAHEAGYNLAAVATGGALIDFAETNSLPHIVLPNEGIQPRSALGLSIIALAKLMSREDVVGELQKLSSKLTPETFKSEGASLAQDLNGKIPVIYSSKNNQALAYNWKIKFNETAKIPAFYNYFPELNHNEMTGFDVIDSTRPLFSNFYFIFLTDSSDSPKIMQRMEVLSRMYQDRGFKVKSLNLSGKTILEKIFNSLILADWTALSLSEIYGTEAEQVPMVEEFKKLIA